MFLAVLTKLSLINFKNDSELVFEVIHKLLDKHFPPSIHEGHFTSCQH